MIRSPAAAAAACLLAGCSAPPPAAAPAAAAVCALPADPVEILRDGAVVLVRWDVDDAPVFSSDTLPTAPGYAAYRRAITDAGGDLPRPIADPHQPKDDREREVWRREDANAALVHGGNLVRPVRCLEAALFAYQDARFSELTHPTELVSTILRRDGRLRIYAGSSDQMFPPGRVYGIDQARADVADGWTFWTILHNHTVQTLAGKPALGSPAPSTNDVHLFRNILEDTPVQEIWVTNGMYTGVVPTDQLAAFHGPP